MGGVAAVHTEVIQDPSDGFTRYPWSDTTDYDVCVSFEPWPGGGIRGHMYGPAVRQLGVGEIKAILRVSPGRVRVKAGSLVDAWKAFVSDQPVVDGRPRGGRRTPYATNIDLTAEPAEELLGRIRELARLGWNVLFGTLLAGEEASVGFFRENLTGMLAREGLRIRFDSSALFLPWPMLCLRADDLPPSELPRTTLPGIFERFLGYRHRIEHTGDIYPAVPGRPNGDVREPVVSLNHDTGVGREIDAVGRVMAALRAQPRFTERTTHGDLIRDLDEAVFDEDLMYFWCHGGYERNGSGTPRFVIRLSDGRDFEVEDFTSVRNQQVKGGSFEPFVLLNACRSLDAEADADGAVLGHAMIEHGARGVLGSHIDMPRVFAAEFALEFVTRYLRGDVFDTAGRIIHGVAREFAERYHNPLGFAYGLHSGMEARIRRPCEDPG